MDTTALAASAVASTVAAYQAQMSMVALRMAAESQQQVVTLLAQGAAQARNPDHLGQQVDAWA